MRAHLLYTASSLSLAALEMLVYLDDENMMNEYSFATVAFNDNLVIRIDAIGRIPSNWSEHPIPDSVREVGDRWIRSKASAVLQVPTVIVPREVNYVINLEHPDVKKAEFGSVSGFVFDKRLIQKKRNR